MKEFYVYIWAESTILLIHLHDNNILITVSQKSFTLMRSDEVMQEIISNPTRYDVSGIYYLDNDVTTNNYPPANTRVSTKKTWTLNQLSSELSPPSKASNPATKTSKTQSQSLATPKKTSTSAEEEKLNKKL